MNASIRVPKALFFDVNETLLDLAPLRESVEKVLPGADSATLWFTTTLHYSVVLSTCGQYAPMPQIGAAALRMLAAGHAHARIDDLFDNQFSVEIAGKFKPHPDVYHATAEKMNFGLKECMMVSAHGWDVAGAAWAGMRTAFVTRGHNRPFPLAPRPELVLAGLAELAASLA